MNWEVQARTEDLQYAQDWLFFQQACFSRELSQQEPLMYKRHFTLPIGGKLLHLEGVWLTMVDYGDFDCFSPDKQSCFMTMHADNVRWSTSIAPLTITFA
jgi:hypothetical protein